MYKLIIKTITPLHIGSQEQLALNLNYVVLGQDACILNRSETAKYLANKKVFDFTKNYSYKAVSEVVKKLANELPQTAISRKLGMSDRFKDYLENRQIEGQMQIGDFINDGRSYYLPASSVKGALLTALGLPELGINSKAPLSKNKFVITDSDPIPERFFVILRTLEGRPPINLVCIKKNLEIELLVKSIGRLDVNRAISGCNEYSAEQLKKALEYLEFILKSKFPDKIDGIENFVKALTSISQHPIKTGEFLLNIGFGGGGWFKVNRGNKPIDKGKSPQTSYEFNISGNISHIGWCVCRFEEVKE